MTRSPNISEDQYGSLVDRVRAMGYDVSKIRRVPHSP
jgi:apolipoprotein D and lipocalin family protein